jgi:hypothetical protein
MFFFFNNKHLLKTTNHGIRHTRWGIKRQIQGSYSQAKREPNEGQQKQKKQIHEIEQNKRTATTLNKSTKSTPC